MSSTATTTPNRSGRGENPRPEGRATRDRRSGLRLQQNLAALALPAFALYGLFVLVALVVAVLLSFVNWPVAGSARFTGLSNWTSFFAGNGLHALAVSGEVIAISLIVQVPLSAALGIFSAGRQRYRAVLSWIYVLPLLVSPTGLAIAWAKLLDPTFGGLSPFFSQTWISDPVAAPIIVTLVFSWRIVPFYVILVQAAVRAIPGELLEAAALDGASRWQQIWRIVLPQIRHSLVVVSILCLTGALTAFDLFFVITGGGPDGATTTLAVGVYTTGFTDGSIGEASVYAVVVTLVGIVVAGLVSRASGFGSMNSER